MNSEELIKLLQKHGVQQIVVRGHNIMGCCPNHDERRPSWGINVNAPHLHGCLACNFKGTLYTLLRHFKYNRSEALALSGGEESEFKLESLTLKNLLVPMKERELYPYGYQISLLKKFATKRGLSVRTLVKAGCRYDEKQNRILFPWREDGQLFDITGRAVKDGNAKIVKYSSGAAKGKMLYLPLGKVLPEDLILVEGEVDALRVMEAGFNNVGALCHGSLGKHLIEKINNSAASRVVAFFDDDGAGQRLTATAQKHIKLPLTIVDYAPFKEKYVYTYRTEYKLDPGSMELDDIRTAIKNSLTLML